MSQPDKLYSFFASQKLVSAPRLNINDQGNMDPAAPLLEDKGRLLLLLNWISFCLVTKPKDQSIAAAMLADGSSTCYEIVLATDTPLTPSQQNYVEHFIETMNNIKRSDIRQGRRDILALVAQYAYERVHRKATLIILAKDPHLYSEETVLEFFTRLTALHPAERNILTAFTNIVSLAPSLLGDVPESRLEALMDIMDDACTLLTSPLLIQLKKGVGRDAFFAAHIYRRLQRLFFYQYGADAFLDPKRRMRMVDRPFMFQWLEYIPPVVLRLPQSSTEYMNDILRSFGFKPTLEQIKYIYPLFQGGDGELWRAGDMQTLRVHPEAQLVEYLLQNKISPLRRTIGCSKRACQACSLCVYRSEHEDETFFRYTMSTDKVQVDWMCPNVDEGMYIEEMGAFEKWVALPYKEMYERAFLGVSLESQYGLEY